MVPDLRRCARLDELNQLLLTRLNDTPVEFGAKEWPRLPSQVVPDHNHVHHVANGVQKAFKPISPELQRLIEQSFTEFRLLDHVDEPTLKTAHVPADFVYDTADAADDRIRRFVAQLNRAITQSVKASCIVSFRPGIVWQVVKGRIREWVMRDIHVEWSVVGHRPAHAEFVRQIMPPLALPLRNDDRALVTAGGRRPNVPSIDA